LANSLESTCHKWEQIKPFGKWKYPVLLRNFGFSKFNDEQFCETMKFPVLYKLHQNEPQERFCMNNCYHNSYVGLRNRYLKEDTNTLTYDRKIMEQIVDELADLLRPHLGNFPSLDEIVATRSGTAKARYVEAIHKISQNGFNPLKNSRISAFIKRELYDEDKTPRMIMGRDPRFNLLFSKFTTWVENALPKVRQFSKGKNFVERGRQFEEIYSDMHRIIEGDFSKFESTQKRQLLEDVELGLFYRLLEKHAYLIFEKIFGVKMHKVGWTAHGMKFYFWLCRGSGDMDTGLGNSLVSWCGCRYFEIKNGLEPGNFAVDGDDNYIRWTHSHDNYYDSFAELGLDSKLILRNNYWDVNYCSGKFVKYDGKRFIYIHNLRKVFANNSYLKVQNSLQFCVGEYLAGLGIMYRNIYKGSRLMEAYSKFLLRPFETKYPGELVRTKAIVDRAGEYKLVDLYDLQSSCFVELDDHHFSNELVMAFGMSYVEQSNMIEYFDNTFMKIPDHLNRRVKRRTMGSNLLKTIPKHVYDVVEETCIAAYKSLTLAEIYTANNLVERCAHYAGGGRDLDDNL